MNIDLNQDIPLDFEIVLDNGRKYKVVDTKRPYVGGEYPDGGIAILMYDKRFLPYKENGWLWLDYSPDQECLKFFFKAANRFAPLIDQD